MDLTRKEIIEKLINEYKYPENGANLMATNLLKIDEKLQLEFSNWWQTNQIPSIEIEGYTINKLIKEYNMNFFAAIVTLDWLIREPELAKKAIAEGYDSIKS